jgi:hypothetical protein
MPRASSEAVASAPVGTSVVGRMGSPVVVAANLGQGYARPDEQYSPYTLGDILLHTVMVK